MIKGFELDTKSELTDNSFSATAQTAWSPSASPDAALRCFKRAVETVPESMQSVSLIGIGCYISRTLELSGCPPADEELFQYYFERTGLFEEYTTRIRQTRAFPSSFRSAQRKHLLMLFHPSKPDAEPLLHLFRNGSPAHRLENQPAWRAKNPSAAKTFATVLLRASYILRLKGMSSMALITAETHSNISQGTRSMRTGSKNV